ncbi:hypothetical protein JQ633_11080 [Bradyrhizobium tropiciagri]|uniref:hypothetical protein n=1 Tax=Bradyrhizobium tropiciagri TaxID=312253 RepID=UPI001BA8F584|nr:hypothetical protein [Bradyrhizobium tropiciagri]MBR0870902.1 hypothetical protein [Bradyrhizobium tropiciagri]
MVSGLSPLREDTATMAQRFQATRIPVGRAAALDPRWLTRLIDAMEEVARPEVRQVPCDPLAVSAAYAHLAGPAFTFDHYGSAYSLRN